MKLIDETDAGRTWLYKGAEAKTVYDDIQAMTAKLKELDREHAAAISPIQAAESDVVTARQAAHAAELEAIQARHTKELTDIRNASQAQLDAATLSYNTRRIAASNEFHAKLRSDNPGMAANPTRMPIIPLGMYESGADVITILEQP